MDLLKGSMADDPATEAYELLSRWAALKRCRSELVQQIGYQPVLDEAEKRIRDNAKKLADLAMVIPDPKGWLEEAREFSAAFDDGKLDASQEVERACSLLKDLDEANLVFAAVQITLKPAVKEHFEFSAQLGECYEWLCDNASLFASAALLIESAAATIRPELCIDDSDDPLGVTAEIYRSLLDMLEEIETEGSVPSFPLRIEELGDFYREHVLRKRGK